MTAAGTQDDRMVIETAVDADDLRAGLQERSPWPYAIEFSNGVSTADVAHGEPFGEHPLATFRLFAEHLPDGLEGGQALDVACQLGHNSLHLRQRYGCAVTGVDASQDNLAKARYLAQVGRIGDVRFLRADPNQLLLSERFDLILHLKTLELLRDPFLALRNTVQMLTPSGCLVLEHAIYRDPEGDDTLCRFHPHRGPQDQGKSWWSLGPAAVLNMLRAAGCARFDIVQESPEDEHIYRRLLIAYRSGQPAAAAAPSSPPSSEPPV